VGGSYVKVFNFDWFMAYVVFVGLLFVAKTLLLEIGFCG